MEHLFVPYEIAQTLKDKGFDEWCLAIYLDKTLNVSSPSNAFFGIAARSGAVLNDNLSGDSVAAPLYQQVVDWFRETHNLSWSIIPDNDKGEYFNICWYGMNEKGRKLACKLEDLTFAVDEFEFLQYYDLLNKSIKLALTLI